MPVSIERKKNVWTAVAVLVDTATRQGDMHGLDQHLLMYFAYSFLFDPTQEKLKEGWSVIHWHT
jgi:hypothetical protein